MRISTLGLLSSIVVSPGVAADLPSIRTAPPSPIAATSAYNWGGFYVGAHIGGSWTHETQTFLGTNAIAADPAGTGYNTNRSGVLGGGDIGYNYQMGQFVIGAAGDFSLTHAKGTSTTNASLIPGLTVTSFGRTDWYGTASARAGFAIDNFLIYGKGGAAWSKQVYGGGAAGILPISYPAFSDTRTGALVGVGAEWAVMKNVSVSAEYNYIYFGKKNYTVTDASNTVTTQYSANPSANILKFGANYHF